MTKLSSSKFGKYLGIPIKHGLYFDGNQHIELQLGRKFKTLSGTIYTDDLSDGACCQTLSISDASDTGAPKELYGVKLDAGAERVFTISVRGVAVLSLGSQGRFDVVADLTPDGSTATSPAAPQVVPRYPMQDAGVAANSKVLFGWHLFPGAINYAFHVWMVSQSGSTTITSSTPVTFSTLVYHKASYIWDDHGFLPGTYQYSLLPLNAKGKALAGWSTPTQITVAS